MAVSSTRGSTFQSARPRAHLLGGVATPALIVWGRDDRIVPLECAERYQKALPHARLEIVENAGHFVDMEQPDVLAQLVARFVTEA